MSDKTMVEITVMIDASGDPDTVCGKLRAKGFELIESLGAIGVLTGRAPADAVKGLAAVKGVAAVEESRNDYGPAD